MRSIDRKFYESESWRTVAKLYLESVNHLCERCLAKGLYTSAKFVHHKIHLTEDNFNISEIAYGFDNLEALCHECHNKEHFGNRPKKRYIVREDGEIITRDEA